MKKNIYIKDICAYTLMAVEGVCKITPAILVMVLLFCVGDYVAYGHLNSFDYYLNIIVMTGVVIYTGIILFIVYLYCSSVRLQIRINRSEKRVGNGSLWGDLIRWYAKL